MGFFANVIDNHGIPQCIAVIQKCKVPRETMRIFWLF